MSGEGKGPVCAAVGIDHRHIFGQLEGMLAAGATFKGWWTAQEGAWEGDFIKRFPDVPRARERAELLEDPEVELALLAGIPSDRCEDAIEAMRNGKDVMVDKPGCTTLEQLERLRKTVAETGRIWTVDFSERFEVPAVTRASELVLSGAIGKVVQTVGLGPHRHNPHTRRDWFYDRDRYGGILCDIGSHQIDQFLHFTGSTDAQVVSGMTANRANPDTPGLEDYGEMLLRTDSASGFVRVDWYTPDALPTWGDGRLFLLGTEGYIELRKYVDVAGKPGTDHLFLVNGDRCERVDCSSADLPYFRSLAADVRDRTETAVSQEHTFKVTELAIKAQMMADSAGGS